MPYYIIMANPLYSRDLQYVACREDNRAQLIKDDKKLDENDTEQSDMTSLCMNLAFVPKDVVAKIPFTAGFTRNLRAAVQEWKEAKLKEKKE